MAAERPLYLLDAKQRIRFASDSLARVLNASTKELIGIDCSKLLPSDDVRWPLLSSLLSIEARGTEEEVRLIPLSLESAFPNRFPSHVLQDRTDASPSNAIFPWCNALILPIRSSDRMEGYFCCWLNQTESLALAAFLQQGFEPTEAMRAAILESRREFTKMEGLLASLGVSAESKRVRQQITAAIQGNMSVVISGPSGSEKGTIARTIFQLRRRRDKRITSQGRLVPVRCSLMDQSLMASMIEMAEEEFTSTPEDAEADRPVLLLEGIDQLASEAHAPLAAYLHRHPNSTVLATSRTEQLRELYPTHKDWRDIVAHLNIFPIPILPLYKRVEDIPVLVALLSEEARTLSDSKSKKGWSQSAILALQAFPWPDNVRQLRDTVQKIIKNSNAPTIDVSDLPIEIRTFPSHALREPAIAEIDLDKTLEDVERHLIQQALQAFPRNRAQAARHLNISRTRLLRRIEQWQLDAESLPQADSEPAKPSTSAAVIHRLLRRVHHFPYQVRQSER